MTAPELQLPDWVPLLRPVRAPDRRPIGSAAPAVWHVDIGDLPAWPHAIDRLRDRAALYGKQSAAIVDAGRPWTAELEVARRLSADGWTGRWLLKYELPPAHFAPWVAMDRPDDVALPAEVRSLIDDIGRAGAPDVVAWRAADGSLRVVGVEVKRAGRNADRIGPKQAEWVRTAIDRGVIDPSDLAVVRWRNDR